MSEPLPWHAEAWRNLVRARREQRLGHALLFAGVAGLGQDMLCGRLVRALLCSQPVEDEACGHCRGCRLLAAETHPDFRRVSFLEREREPGRLKTEIGVDQLRELGRGFALTAQMGGAQIAVIEPADRMTHAASNALLKTLEEPAPQRYLFLLTDHPERLSATVRSRCQRVLLPLPSHEVAMAWLAEQGLQTQEAARALQHADGHPMHARSWLQQGGLQRSEAVRADLQALASKRACAQAVCRRWLSDDAALQLADAAQLVRQLGRQRALGGLCLTATPEFHKLAAWSVRADTARRQLALPLRHELMLTDLLLAWANVPGAAAWFEKE